MNKLMPRAHAFRTFQPYLALFLLLFLVSCHHKAASKQAKIEKQKEKTYQAEQKEMADKKMEKKNKTVKSADVVGSKSPKNAEMPKKTAAKSPKKDELAGLQKVENLYKPTAKTPETLPKTAENGVKTPETKNIPVETSSKGPLSKNAEKAPVAAMPKPSAPVATATPKNVNVSPINASPMSASQISALPIDAANSAKMGNCIAFLPNKAAISDDSRACLKEISTYLKNNKSLRLAISANVLPTEKVADAMILKTERAKTVRNFLIQSGIEASRLTVKLSDSKDAAAIVLTPDGDEKRKK